jgi:hypothetical protein
MTVADDIKKWSIGVLEYWKNGRMEFWNVGMMQERLRTSFALSGLAWFGYSSIPLFQRPSFS